MISRNIFQVRVKSFFVKAFFMYLILINRKIIFFHCIEQFSVHPKKRKRKLNPPNSARHQRHNLFCQKIGVARRVPRINNGGSLENGHSLNKIRRHFLLPTDHLDSTLNTKNLIVGSSLSKWETFFSFFPIHFGSNI